MTAIVSSVKRCPQIIVLGVSLGSLFYWGAINQSLADVTLQTFELSAMKNGINKLDLPIVIFLAGMLSVLFQIRNFMISTTFVSTKYTQTLFSDI